MDTSKETQPGKLLIVTMSPDELKVVVREAVAAALGTITAPAVASEGWLTKAQTARALGVSVATVDRFVREAMPYETVGNGKRFDLAACREWLASRGRKPTTPKTSAPKPDLETERLLGNVGLRLVAGGGQ